MPAAHWNYPGALNAAFGSPPAHSNQYPKLEATGLGSILREACTRDKEGRPEREDYDFYIKALAYAGAHQFLSSWELCFSY